METTVEPIEITYTDENSVRVDQFLSQHFEISRAQSKALCKEGAVTLNGKKTKASESLNEGDKLTVVYDKKKELKKSPLSLDPLP